MHSMQTSPGNYWWSPAVADLRWVWRTGKSFCMTWVLLNSPRFWDHRLHCRHGQKCGASGFQQHDKIVWQITRGGLLFGGKIIVISRSDLIRNGSLSVRLKLSRHLLHGRDTLKFRPCLHWGWLRGTLCVDYIHLLDGSNSVMLLHYKLEGDWWKVAENQFPVCVPFHHDATCLTTCDSFNLYTVPSWMW